MTADSEQTPAQTNRSMPVAVIIPVLAYPDVRQAVDWLCRTFGFVERLRIADHRAQLTFGAGSIVVTAQNSEAAPPSAHSIMVRVADLDSHFAQSVEQGAEIVAPPADYPYGERQYSVHDLGGHLWTFSQTIEDIDPHSWGGLLIE